MAASADLEEEEIKMILFANNRYDHDAPFFGPIFLGGSGIYKYKDANGGWVPRCQTTFTGGLTVPGMNVDRSNMTYEFVGQYGEEQFAGDCYFLVGRPQFSSSRNPNTSYRGSYEEEATIFADGSVIQTTYKYFVWVDDAYDMYTNTTTIVYPTLINQSAQGSFIPGDFVEGHISPIVDNQDMWEPGDIWIVANAAADSSATPRGIYRLDVENLAVDQDDTFYVTVCYYNSDRRTKLWEESFLIAPGMRQLTVGNFPRQTQYASYYIVIQIANVSDTVNTALKYRLRIGRTKPIVLVHGIRSGPRSQADLRNGDVFCDNLHYILESNYYCKCYFLLHHSGNDPVKEVLSGRLDGGRTNFINLLRYTHLLHAEGDNDNQIAVIAHSEGATLTRLCAYYRDDFKRDVAKVLTFGGVHIGSAFANCYPDTPARLNSLRSGGISIEVKSILELGGCASLWCNTYPLPVPLYACNGCWGSAADRYMRDCFYRGLAWHFPYSEIERTYPSYSDGMVPNMSACPSYNTTRNYVLGANAGMAHDRPEVVGGPLFTETHIQWNNYRQHPTYNAIEDILFYNRTPAASEAGQDIGCVMLNSLPRMADYRDQYFLQKDNNRIGMVWWQDEDRKVPAIVRTMERGSYMVMAEHGQYDIVRQTLADVCVYHTSPSWCGVITNGYTNYYTFTNIFVQSCTVTRGCLTQQ